MVNKEIAYHTIAPIFDYGLLSKEFTHNGTYNDAKFSISLKRIASGREGFKELVKNADKSIHRSFQSIHIPPRFLMGPATDDFLFIDVTYKYGKKYEVSGNTVDTNIITHCILESLRLHSSKGVLFHNSYTFRSLPNPHTGFCVMTSSPLMPQYSFGHLKGGVSVLKEDDYINCKNTFDILLRNNLKDTHFYKIINLALSYHMTTFNLQTIEHSFLILMIIFESLFKKDSDETLDNSADRISKLITELGKSPRIIKNEFYGNSNETFCNIRNDIAHGHNQLDKELIKAKYQILYKYITTAIIKLLIIYESDINDSKDFYDELDTYLSR